jgi:micrococcal nuclease
VLFRSTRVVDGDTVVINGGEKVRLIGLNTPETVDPKRPVECFGPEASSEAKKILTGQTVRLETDPSQDARDKYGRLLAYVFLEDGTNFDEFMIENGYGYEYTYRTAYKYQKEFKAAEKEAQANGRGLWAVCK